MRHSSPYELNILSSHKIDPVTITDLNIPVEYIVNEGEFFEHKFKLSRSTLIPRVETEYLIELALKFINTRCITFADVGCGSGAIGITFGIELAKRNIMFCCNLSDVSDDALKTAQENLKSYRLALKDNKVLIFKSNLLKSYSKEKKLDIIFANLPYIPSERIEKLDKSVKDFEPVMALDGGGDGLHYIRELLNSTAEYISPKGVILLEVDDTHNDSSEFSKNWDIEIKNDFNGKVRYWICKLK